VREGLGRPVARLVVGALLLISAPPARAADLGALDAPGRTIGWVGTYVGAASLLDPAECVPDGCDERLVRVAIPARWWRAHRAALEIAIRWPSEHDDFDLYVYRPDGSEVPAARGRVGSAEAIHDRRPMPGTYRILVVARRVTASAYEGAVQPEPRPRRRGLLLPNLRTLPPANLRIAAPAYENGEPVPVNSSSCRADEPGVTRCLRFDTSIANVGRGELRMRFLLSGLGSDQRMQQVIRRRPGLPLYRSAGEYVWHEAHGHVHYEGFASARLFRSDGEPVARAMKAGFCLQDTTLGRWPKRGNGPTTFVFPDCNEVRERDSRGEWGVMGISRGWIDTYTWDLPGQYVPLDGVPDGEYALIVKADAASAVLETRETDNASWARIALVDGAVEVLASGRGGLRAALGG